MLKAFPFLAVLALLALPSRANVLGIHTMIQDNNETFQQLDEAADLCGWGGWVKQFMYVKTVDTFDPRMLAFVDGARQRRLNVVARLHYVPAAYAADPRNGASKPKNDADGSFTSYKNLMRNYVKGFHGRLHYAEIWNEPNLNYEWNGQANPEEFVKALMAGYDGVKEADPTCQVLFPGLAPTNSMDGGNMDNLVFLARCYQSTYRCPRDGKYFQDHWDILGNHSYALNHPATYDGDKFSVYGYTYELNVAYLYADAGKPVLITECGYSIGEHEDARYPAVNEQYRADNTAAAFHDVWARDPRVLGAMPYYLHAAERATETPFWWVHNDGSHAPVYYAVRALKPLLADVPGNISNIYGNAPRDDFFDPLDMADVLATVQAATGQTPPGQIPAYLVTTADVAPKNNPDGALTLEDAARTLRLTAGLE